MNVRRAKNAAKQGSQKGSQLGAQQAVTKVRHLHPFEVDIVARMLSLFSLSFFSYACNAHSII